MRWRCFSPKRFIARLRSLRREAIERFDRSAREKLMLLAIEQEMLAEQLSDRCLEG
jgi:hypothetical protein